MKKRKLSNFVTKILLSIIFCFVSLIYVKKNDSNLAVYENYVFENTMSFNKVNKVLNKYLDTNLLLGVNKDDSMVVFSSPQEFIKQKFENGTKIKYSSNMPINSLESGIVVYIGEKDNLGNTIIIQGIDGYDIWYSNISDSNLNIYDYIDKNTIIGNSKELIITISKDGNYVEYDEYNKKV